MYTKPMWLEKKLLEDLPVHPNAMKTADLFGVEIELEGKNILTADPAVSTLWTTHNDQSLRVLQPGAQATEYVLRHPLNFDTTMKALDGLYGHLNRVDVTVFPSYRTSIHVHLNMAMEPARHVYNFITLAILFDELFVSQNGDHRRGNNFCLRARDAEGQVTELINSIETTGGFLHLNAHNRYSSVNFVSLAKFGTIEFRSLECTTDLERVKHWIATLDRLKKMSREFDNPQEIIGYYSKMNPREFLYFVLGAQASKYSKVEDWNQMLHVGMRLAQDFAFCSKWVARKPEERPAPVPAKPRKKPFNPAGAQPAVDFAWIQQMNAIVAQQNAQGAQPAAPQPVAMPQWAWPAPAVEQHNPQGDWN